jgi:hypothetical protein
MQVENKQMLEDADTARVEAKDHGGWVRSGK